MDKRLLSLLRSFYLTRISSRFPFSLVPLVINWYYIFPPFPEQRRRCDAFIYSVSFPRTRFLFLNGSTRALVVTFFINHPGHNTRELLAFTSKLCETTSTRNCSLPIYWLANFHRLDVFRGFNKSRERNFPPWGKLFEPKHFSGKRGRSMRGSSRESLCYKYANFRTTNCTDSWSVRMLLLTTEEVAVVVVFVSMSPVQS